jgi:hypothetical protein
VATGSRLFSMERIVTATPPTKGVPLLCGPASGLAE